MAVLEPPNDSRHQREREGDKNLPDGHLKPLETGLALVKVLDTHLTSCPTPPGPPHPRPAFAEKRAIVGLAH